MTSTGAVVCHYGLFVIKIFSLLSIVVARMWQEKTKSDLLFAKQ